MRQSDTFTLPYAQANQTQQTLLESLLGLTMKLRVLDQSNQPSDAVEQQLQRVHRELASIVHLSQPFQVTRDGQVYLVSLSPVGVTYQLQHSFDCALQATA